MNDRRPVVDRDSRARLGRKLSSDYNLMPDPMLPEQLSDLVAKLLEMDAQLPAASEASAGPAKPHVGGWPRGRHDDCLLG